MAHPVVIRIAKLTTYGNVASSGGHTWREMPTHNADPSRTPTNSDLRKVQTSAALVDAVKARIALATDKAKEPVLVLEYLISAKREAFLDHGGKVDADAYFRDAMAWLEAKHGADNIVAANIQRDEQAPHLVAYVVPLVEEDAKTRKRSVIVGTNPDGSKRRETREFRQAGRVKLSAAHFVDGRQKLRDLQTEFAAMVGTAHGLVRGVEGSRATHTTVREYYARASARYEPLPLVTVAKPKPVPAEPRKPGFMSGRAASEAWQVDHAKWERECANADSQAEERRTQILQRRDAALRLARTYEAQAREVPALRRNVENLKSANGWLTVENDRLQARAEVAGLFTLAEIDAARRRKAMVEAEAVQRAGEVIERATIDEEAQRRADRLEGLLARSAGAVWIFANRALEALRAARNVVANVNWRVLHSAVIRECLYVNHDPAIVARALVEHSPGCCDQMAQQAAVQEVRDYAGQSDVQDARKPRTRGLSM